MTRSTSCLLLALALAPAPLLHAQPAPQPARPDPLDARAPVPPAVHVSPLARFRSAHDVPVGSWKDANDTVTRIGGWRTYTREAHAPEPAASSPAPGSAASAPRPLEPVRAPTPAAPASGSGSGHGIHGTR